MKRAAAAVGFLVVAAGCAGARVAERRLPQGLAWPAEAPRVRLERVVESRRSGGPLSLLGGGRPSGLFQRPYGVAWQGPDLLAADPGARRVVRIAADGRVTASPEQAAGTPVGVAACAQGIVATDSEGGRVALLGPQLQRVSWLAEGLNRPTGVACLGTTVFVVETGSHRIVVLEPDGGRRYLGERGAGPGQFNYPTALALAGGSLWIGDTLNFRVQRLDPATGAFQDAFGRLGDEAGEMPRVKGLAVDPDGQVWVSDAHLDQVSLYTPTGSLLLSLGRSGVEPGEFSFPAGIAASPDGRLAVADALNRRIQVFRLTTPAAP